MKYPYDTGFAQWVENDQPAFPALISDWNGTPLNGEKWVKADIVSRPGTPIDTQ